VEFSNVRRLGASNISPALRPPPFARHAFTGFAPPSDLNQRPVAGHTSPEVPPLNRLPFSRPPVSFLLSSLRKLTPCTFLFLCMLSHPPQVLPRERQRPSQQNCQASTITCKTALLSFPPGDSAHPCYLSFRLQDSIILLPPPLPNFQFPPFSVALSLSRDLAPVILLSTSFF